MAHKRSRQAFEADIQKHESPFVLYGTPLPPLDEQARDDGSYVPVWQQEVTDDRGRKRLHGAFTGGFSAGYFNTVGSKEGWTPATFVSSRTNRMKDSKNSAHQRAEDFMDEEDIREAEESRVLSTADGFAGFGTEDDPMHRNAMLDLLRPTEYSMGSKLLNKMGWKEGQGIGPRVRRRADADDLSSDAHLFAPEDTPMISLIKKHDFKGLGYESEAGPTHVPVRSSSKNQPQSSIASDDGSEETTGSNLIGGLKESRKPLRGGFGVGILNDTGSDDEDPYSMGPKISYNRSLGGDKKPKKIKPLVTAANPMLKRKPIFISKKLSSMQNALRKCHDGRLPLQGFVLANELDSFSTMSLTDDKYKPPEVPADWKPARAVDSKEPTTEYQSTSSAAKSSTHTATSRASVLGETSLPGKSVFDYLTPAARDRLMKASGRTNLPQAMSEELVGTSSPAPHPVKTSGDVMPYLDPQTAQQALARSAAGGFMPYIEDLAKRQRYKTFLEISAGFRADTELPPRPPGPNITSEDHQNELNEFLRAAEVFRPVTGGLGSRFTSSSTPSTAQPGSGPTGKDSKPTSAEDLLSRPAQQKKAEDPAEVAAKIGMFGPLTRSILSFQPTRLVAKRFGVDYVGAGGRGDTGAHVAFDSTASSDITSSTSRFQTAGYIIQGQDRNEDEDSGGNGGSNRRLDADNEQLREARSQAQQSGMSADLEHHPASFPSTAAVAVMIDPDKNEALEQERPGQAVFRAIFGSDDDDDDNDDDE